MPTRRAKEKARPRPGEEAPLFPAAALGFRVWGVDGRFLVGATHSSYEWQPGVSTAGCQYGHRAPHPLCSCGLYAYHDLEAALAMPLSFPGIVGAIAGRGRLQVHAQGFRCQQAQILALLQPSGPLSGSWLDRLGLISRRRARQIAARYRVPLFQDPEELAAHARRFASEVPKVLRPRRAR